MSFGQALIESGIGPALPQNRAGGECERGDRADRPEVG
jgi:hypothetical protein